MFIVYPVISLGPIKGNKQSVSVYDSKFGNNRTVVTTPEEAEEFINYRNSALKKACRQGLGITALATTLGAGAGALYTRYKNTNLNKLIDKINPEIIDYARKTGKDGYSLKHDFLDLKKISTFGDLSKTFSNTKNLFEKVKLTKGMGEIAIIPGLIGTLIGLVTTGIKVDKTDYKITQQFINDNK